MSIEIIIGNDSPIVEVLSRLMFSGNEKTQLMDLIGLILADDIRENFIRQSSPDGVPWVQSHRAAHHSGQTLRDTGYLMNSLMHVVSDSGNILNVGTSVKYAHALHYGATIKASGGGMLKFKTPSGGFVQKEEVVLPARPFIGISLFAEVLVGDVINNLFNRST